VFSFVFCYYLFITFTVGFGLVIGVMPRCYALYACIICYALNAWSYCYLTSLL